MDTIFLKKYHYLLSGLLLWICIGHVGCATVVDIAGKIDEKVNRTEQQMAGKAEQRKWKPVQRQDLAAEEHQYIKEGRRRDSAFNNLITRYGLPDYIRVEDGEISHAAYLQSGAIYAISHLDTPAGKVIRQHYGEYRNLPDFLVDAFSVAAIPEKRLALVMGNAAYPQSIGPLTQPLNDARGMATTLRGLGFDVMMCENCSRVMMQRALRRFGSQVSAYKVRLVYFSGHGLQFEGRNYLIPVDAAFQSAYDVNYKALGLQEIFDTLHTLSNVTNIVILDACRNNPLGGTEKGLAEVHAPRNVLVAYATAPGKVAFEADDSLYGFYTGALLKHIATPNIAISEMLGRVRSDVLRETYTRQMPWETTSLILPFYILRY